MKIYVPLLLLGLTTFGVRGDGLPAPEEKKDPRVEGLKQQTTLAGSTQENHLSEIADGKNSKTLLSEGNALQDGQPFGDGDSIALKDEADSIQLAQPSLSSQPAQPSQISQVPKPSKSAEASEPSKDLSGPKTSISTQFSGFSQFSSFQNKQNSLPPQALRPLVMNEALDEGSDLFGNSEDSENSKNSGNGANGVDERYLSIDKYFSNFDNFDCSHKASNKQVKGELNADTLDFSDLCPSILKESALHTIGEFDVGRFALARYLNEEVYSPLGMGMTEKDDVGELVSDAIFNSSKAVRGASRPSFGSLRSKVLSIFEEMNLKSQDAGHFRPDLDKLLASVLGEFHRYWNALRGAGEFERSRSDTREALRLVLQSFDLKQRFFAEAAKALAGKIKEGFYRFVKAHRTVEALQANPTDIIVRQMVRRYSTAVIAIQEARSTPRLLVREMDFILRLLRIHQVVCFRKGIQEAAALEDFNTNVFLRITNFYEQLALTNPPGPSDFLPQARDFTATLLLKMKHLNHVIYKYHRVNEFTSIPQMHLNFKSRMTVKAYYEIFDNMLMLPRACITYLTMKKCAVQESNRVLEYIADKYQLKYSTSGWEFLNYIEQMVKTLFSKATHETWSDWTKFKNYFYLNLLTGLINLKERYRIAALPEFEKLEDRIGVLIYNITREDPNLNDTINLVEKLEEGIYDKLLDIKADFNSPGLEGDLVLINTFKTQFHNFLLQFLKENQSELDEHFVKLVNQVGALVESWEGGKIQKSKWAQTPITLGQFILSSDIKIKNPNELDRFVNRDGFLTVMDSPLAGQQSPYKNDVKPEKEEVPAVKTQNKKNFSAPLPNLSPSNSPDAATQNLTDSSVTSTDSFAKPAPENQNGMSQLTNPMLDSLEQSIIRPDEPQPIQPQQETPLQETPQQETPQQETPLQETPQQETPLQETPQQETPLQETPQQETPLQETPQQETPLQETPQQETPQFETTQLNEPEMTDSVIQEPQPDAISERRRKTLRSI